MPTTLLIIGQLKSQDLSLSDHRDVSQFALSMWAGRNTPVGQRPGSQWTPAGLNPQPSAHMRVRRQALYPTE